MRLLAALALAAATATADSQSSHPAGQRIQEIPEARYVARRPLPRRPLRRAHDLFHLATSGEGISGGSSPAPLTLGSGLSLDRVPWRLPPAGGAMARLVRWLGPAENAGEEMLGLVLGAGQSWCSPELALEPGSRLRFEGVSLEADGPGRLEVTQSRGDRDVSLAKLRLQGPTLLAASAQTDVPLDARPSSVCFKALDRAVAVTEPRVLVPEEPAQDTRPRWIVLTIVDDLRGDQIDGPEADASCPQLAKLARAGHSYRAAISPGCHTLAAVPQILAGRDLMRIDPVQRLMSPTLNRIGPASKEAIYSRGSLFVTEMAESVGYHSVFLGNNGFLAGWPAFSRASIQNNSTTGTVDTAERLPDLLSRYADERVMLVYYISAPHAHSATPRRLFESFGCGALSGIEEARCAYKARVRHGDEGLAALEAALQDNGLSDHTLQIITADHGENFHDSPPHERLRVGVLSLRSDEAHGSGCGLTELRVPLVVTGPAVEPAVWSAPVSALDIVPTILSVLRMSPVNRLDGEALPLMARDRVTTLARAFASYGFCNESFFDGNAQLLWWQSDCTERRSVEGSPRTHTLELWQGGILKATEVGEPQVVGPKVGQLKAWIASRLPSQALLLDASRLPPSTVTVTALEGEIKDFGPSSTVDGLAAIRGVRLDKVSKSVEIAFDGYRGLYYVATDPETAPVTVKVASQDGARLELPLFLGPLQIPVAASGRPIRPREDHELLVARGTPGPQPGDGLRLWWQPYGAMAVAVREQSPSDIDRVLREWGYVR